MNTIQGFRPPVMAPVGDNDKLKSGSLGFRERLDQAVKEVNNLQHTADDAAEKVTMGELGIHEGMLALHEADISLRYMVQAKNKAMDAYREIMRMQL